MSTTSRGYGHQHRQARRRWQQAVDQGRATCSRCGLPILPGQAWDLDHTDDRGGYLGPAHATCNRADGARKTNTQRRERRPVSRPW